MSRILAWVFCLLPLAAFAADESPYLFDTADRFAKSISAGKRFKRYDLSALMTAVERFNKVQDRRYHVDPNDPAPPPDHHHIDIEEAGDIFILRFKIALTEHAGGFGIDPGEDAFLTFAFDKKTLKQVSRVQGLVLGEERQPLRIAVPGKSTCAGSEIKGPYRVVDLRNGASYYAGELPVDTVDVKVDNPEANVFEIQATGQTSLDDERGGNCEVGGWARMTRYTATLHCDPVRSACTLQKSAVKSYEGCDEYVCD